MRVTQPIISLQIACLEQRLSFPLVDRGNGRLKSTPGGMLFYAEADKVLAGMNCPSEAVRQIRTALAGSLTADHPSATIYHVIVASCARDRAPSILPQFFLSMPVDKLAPLYA